MSDAATLVAIIAGIAALSVSILTHIKTSRCGKCEFETRESVILSPTEVSPQVSPKISPIVERKQIEKQPTTETQI